MLTIKGSYKFNTVASFFISLYIKVEFFINDELVTHNQYAQVLSTGKALNFWDLRGDLRNNNYTPSNRYRFRGEYSIDLSPEVKVTILAVNNDNIVYQRVFDNYHQYSIHHPNRISVWDNIKIPEGAGALPDQGLLDYPNYPGLQYALPDISAYVDFDSTGNLSIYGLINPNSFLNLYTNKMSEYLYPNSAGYYDYIDKNFYRTTGSSFGGLYFPVLSFKNHEPLIEIGEISYIKDNNCIGNSLIGHAINYVGGGLFTSSWHYTYGNSEGDGNIAYQEPGNRIFNFYSEGNYVNTMFPGYNFGGGYGGTFPISPVPPSEYPRVSPFFPSTFAHIYPQTQISNPVGFPYFLFNFPYLQQSYTLSSNYYIDIDDIKPVTYNIYPNSIHPELVGSAYEKYEFSVPLYDPIIKDSKTGKLMCQLSQHPDTSPDSLTPPNSYYLKVGNEIIPFDTSTLPEQNYDGVNQMTDTDIGRKLGKALPGWFYHRKPSFFLYDDKIYTSKIYFDNDKKFSIEIEKNKPIIRDINIIRNINYYGSEYFHDGTIIVLKIPSLLNSYLKDKDYTEFTEKTSNKLYTPFINAMIENYPDGDFIIPFEEDDYSFSGIKSSNEILSGSNCYSSSTKTFWKYCNSVFNPKELD